MIGLLWNLSIRTHDFLQTWMPTNIVIRAIRTRTGLKYGLPAMLLAIPYLGVAYWCTTLIANGAPGWLHLIVLLTVWNAIKFVAIGPVSVILLVRARIAEHRISRLEAATRT